MYSMKSSVSIIRIFQYALIPAVALLGLSSKQLFGDVAYLRSNTSAPWGVTSSNPGSNEAAMNTVFGTGNWADSRFETVNANLLFSSAYTFIFLEGGDNTANSMENFLITNGTLIQNWVSNGGNLILNAAPNTGDGMSLGFGVNLNYNNVSTLSSTGTAADSTHVIFNGPYGQTGSRFTGTRFSHATVSGNDLTPLILGDVGTVLAEMSYGQGHILFGGMTLASYHAPKPDAYNLLANIVAYGYDPSLTPIPEPSAYALITATGLLGCVAIRRRKQK